MSGFPAQSGGSPRGHAAGVCAERPTAQSSRMGSHRRQRLEDDTDHTVGQWPGECEYELTLVRLRLCSVLAEIKWIL